MDSKILSGAQEKRSATDPGCNENCSAWRVNEQDLKEGTFLGGPVVKTGTPKVGAQVQFLVRELIPEFIFCIVPT